VVEQEAVVVGRLAAAELLAAEVLVVRLLVVRLLVVRVLEVRVLERRLRRAVPVGLAAVGAVVAAEAERRRSGL
jgi:hypothetical protein